MGLKNLILTSTLIAGFGSNYSFAQEQAPQIKITLELRNVVGGEENDIIKLNVIYSESKRVEYLFTEPHYDTGFSSKGKRVYYNGKFGDEKKFTRKEADSIFFKIMDKHKNSKPGKYLVDQNYGVLDTLD